METLTKLLEKVANKPRRPVADELHSYAKAVLDSRPMAFWRLGEIECTPLAPQEAIAATSQKPADVQSADNQMQGISQSEMGTMVAVNSTECN